jgi:hypothetical protein
MTSATWWTAQSFVQGFSSGTLMLRVRAVTNGGVGNWVDSGDTSYVSPPSGGGGTWQVDEFTGDGTTDTFTLSFAPLADSEFVFVDKALQVAGMSLDYTISGTSLVFNAGAIPISGADIIVRYPH